MRDGFIKVAAGTPEIRVADCTHNAQQCLTLMRQAAEQVYVRQFGHVPEYLTVHAGLEVGLFSQYNPDLDDIAIGPDCWNFHSPSEQVSVSSTQRVYDLLRGILTECRV